MLLLLDFTIFEKAFSFSNELDKYELLSILHNSNSKICFSKGMLDYIESKISEKDIFQSFIKEITDTDRIVIHKSNSSLSYHEQFIQIFENANVDFLIPITEFYQEEFVKIKSKLITFKNISKINKNWIVFRIITDKNCTVCYNDFNDDDEINTFFESIYSIPKYIKKVVVFNRQQEYKHSLLYTFT